MVLACGTRLLRGALRLLQMLSFESELCEKAQGCISVTTNDCPAVTRERVRGSVLAVEGLLYTTYEELGGVQTLFVMVCFVLAALS